MLDWAVPAIGVIILAGGLAQGATGVGLGLVAAPIVAAIEPRLVPGPLLIIMVFASAWTAWRDRVDINWSWTGPALVGRIPGTVLAAWVLGLLSLQLYSIAFALAVMLGVVASVISPRITPSRTGLIAGGFGSGFMGTLTAIGGPPIILAIQNGPPPVVRATLSVFFTFGALMSILALYLFGQFGRQELLLGLAIAPPMLIGVYASRYLKQWVDTDVMRPVLLGMALVAAPLLIFRAATVG
jgi:uncharacterized membrane protein YfcA